MKGKKILILSARGKNRNLKQGSDTNDNFRLHILLSLLGIFGTNELLGFLLVVLCIGNIGGVGRIGTIAEEAEEWTNCNRWDLEQ